MRSRRKSFPWFKTMLVLFLLLILVSGGIVGSLLAAGVPMQRLAFWVNEEEPAEVISLPMNWQPIAAYSRVSRNDLVNPQTGAIEGVEIPLSAVAGISATINGADGTLVDHRVERADRTDDGIVLRLENGDVVRFGQLVKLGGAFVQPTDIIGRVVSREKTPGFAFSESSFFRSGTPSGLAGATPPGMRAMTLEATRLAGVHRISMGEQIDLVANIPVKKLARFESSTGGGLIGGELLVGSSRSGRDEDKETTARLVARQAIVLMPVVERVSTESSASLTQGRRLLSVPVEEVVLAVAAEDVSAVTAALELEATVNVLVRSGRIDSPSQPESAPEGMVAVPVPGQTLLAYQTIRPISFEDPATAYVRTINVPIDTANASNWITDLSGLVGRVPKHDLPSTVPIREDDLMPAGTASGLSAATPQDRVLFFLDSETLVGGDALEFGQRLDLVASRTDEAQRRGGRQFANVSLTDAQRTTVEPVATDVLVMMPSRSPGNPTRSRVSEGQNDRSSAKLIVAVHPDQVALLEYAVAIGSNLRATVQSGQILTADLLPPPQPADRVTAMRFDPLADAKRTDIFIGGSKQSQLFRGRP